MENRIIRLLFCIMFLVNSCSAVKTVVLDTPFVSVVKLIDAEQSLHFDVAEQYMDVIQVYTRLGSENPYEDWENEMRLRDNLGKDNKFTNNFGYAHYDIEETINGNTARVAFNNQEENPSIKSIIYGLERRNKEWIVVSIEYIMESD